MYTVAHLLAVANYNREVGESDGAVAPSLACTLYTRHHSSCQGNSAYCILATIFDILHSTLIMYPLIIISGPAGVGKTTVAKALLKTFPELRSSVTYTTRRPRQLSTEDKKMYYVNREEFERRREAGEFLEWATVHGDYYGTHKAETLAVLQSKPVIFNIDVQGAEQLMQQFQDQRISIFLLPESYEQMIDHIKNRGEMTEGNFQARLKSAEFELTRKDMFDYQIVNAEGKLNETIDKIAKLIQPYLSKGNAVDKD